MLRSQTSALFSSSAIRYAVCHAVDCGVASNWDLVGLTGSSLIISNAGSCHAAAVSTTSPTSSSPLGFTPFISSFPAVTHPLSVSLGVRGLSTLLRRSATAKTPQYAPPSLQRRHTSTKKAPHLLEELSNLPNLLSLSRVASAPVISWLILQQQWPAAVALLLAAGVTDWLDGAVARHRNQQSRLGSYLDPLADKILICTLVGTLSSIGSLPFWVSSLIIGRDAGLIALTFVYRFRMLGWKWPGFFQFFNVDDASVLKEAGEMQRVQPILLSKVNTVLQMGLIGMCISQPWLGWPGGQVLELTEYTVLATTVASGGAYGIMYLSNRLYPRKE